MLKERSGSKETVWFTNGTYLETTGDHLGASICVYLCGLSHAAHAQHKQMSILR